MLNEEHYAVCLKKGKKVDENNTIVMNIYPDTDIECLNMDRIG